jgi:hypothetical protein
MKNPYSDDLYLEIACGEMSPEAEAKCKQILDMLKEDRAANRTAYSEGYEAAVEQIFTDIEAALNKHFTKLNYTDGTCTFVFHRDLEIELADIKKKYEAK